MTNWTIWASLAGLLVSQVFTVVSLFFTQKTLRLHQDHLGIHDKMLFPVHDQ